MSTDSFSEITGQSWFGRLGDSIMGVLIGVLLFAVSFPLLWWNEGRAVKTAKGLSELGGSVISVSADKVDPAMEKKPVHVTGRATTDENVTDSLFPISAKAIKLVRHAEIYEWKEDSHAETRKKFGGGTETVTTYDYKTGWHPEIIDSQHFKQPEGHANPEKMRFLKEEKAAQLVKIGAFRLPPDLISQMKENDSLPFTPEDVQKLPAEIKSQAFLDANVLYIGHRADKPADPQNPQVGDLRISFAAVRPATVSTIAQQLGDTFEPWTSRNGERIERLMSGEVSAQNMVGQMETENTQLTWILRLVGFLLMAFGIGLAMNPLSVFADVIPFLGGLMGAGIALFAAVIAAGLSLTTIALAWIAYRPLFGIGLLVIALALVVGVKMLFAKEEPLPASLENRPQP